MTKTEFLEILRRALNAELSEEEVRSNVDYYRNYIGQQTGMGKSEEEVIAQLGDPRLIARTILQVDQQKEEEYGSVRSEQTVYTESADGTYQESYSARGRYSDEDGSPSGADIKWKVSGSGWKVWLILALILFIVFTVLGTVFAILWKLLPIILIAAGIMWVYHKFTAR